MGMDEKKVKEFSEKYWGEHGKKLRPATEKEKEAFSETKEMLLIKTGISEQLEYLYDIKYEEVEYGIFRKSIDYRLSYCITENKIYFYDPVLDVGCLNVESIDELILAGSGFYAPDGKKYRVPEELKTILIDMSDYKKLNYKECADDEIRLDNTIGLLREELISSKKYSFADEF